MTSEDQPEPTLEEKWDEAFAHASIVMKIAMLNVRNIIGVEDID